MNLWWLMRIALENKSKERIDEERNQKRKHVLDEMERVKHKIKWVYSLV